jgi:Holliday junction resolvase-like predicted endonuclease
MKNVGTDKMGENIECQYLLKNFYLILARNHKERFNEIDIIARAPHGVSVFCEVKTSNYKNSGFMPEDNSSPTKRQKIVKANNISLAWHPELAWENDG